MREATDEARNIVAKLGLTPHPEGGWFRETWRSSVRNGERAIGTAIYFLLEEGQRSQWHQVDADEFWLWHAGAPLEVRIADADGSNAQNIALGPEVLTDEQPQLLIPAGCWQATTAHKGWALVSCFVAPGFEFAGFKLASAEEAAKLDRASV